MVNCAREKLDCCPVTIKVSSFIVKASDCPPRKEILAVIIYKTTFLRRQSRGTLFSPSKSEAIWFSSTSVCWPRSLIKLAKISLNWFSSMAHYKVQVMAHIIPLKEYYFSITVAHPPALLLNRLHTIMSVFVQAKLKQEDTPVL